MRNMLMLATMALVGPVVALSQQTESRGSQEPQDKAEWQWRLREAEARRSSGRIVTIVGVGIATTGIVLVSTAWEGHPIPTIHIERRNTRRLATGLGLSGAGGVLAVIGARRWMRGGGEVRDLEAEGRQKGFLRVGLAPSGKGLAVAYVF